MVSRKRRRAANPRPSSATALSKATHRVAAGYQAYATNGATIAIAAFHESRYQ